MARLDRPIRSAIAAVRAALSNDGIRRLELVWTFGIAADAAILVIFLVVVYTQSGAVATGILGAVRMGPAVLAGMLSGATLARFQGRRVLVAIGLTRTACALLAALVIATRAPIALLYLLAAGLAVAGAPVRPSLATLMPGLARSPAELVAANMAWSTGEGLGTFAGPFVAGVLIGFGQPALAAAIVALTFAATVFVAAGLRFEQREDAGGGAAAGGGGVGLLEGLRALRHRPVPGWTMVGVFSQVMTRGLLGPLAVVASIELLAMGQEGVGLLNAALGLGGLVGAVFALGVTRADRLIRTQSAALFAWGAPLAVLGILPIPAVALAALVAVGVGNAVYDVAIITIFQRGTANDERSAVFSIFEGVVGLGSVSGSLLAPVLLAAFGPRGALVVSGSIAPIVALVILARVGRADRISVVDEPLVHLLREVHVFAELPLTAVERLSSGLVPVHFAKGEVLMRQGEAGDRFVVVEHGSVEVSVDGRVANRLGPGGGVGEIALMHRAARTATVVAETEVTGYSVDSATFLAAVSGPASIAVAEQIAAGHLARAGGPLLSLEA